MNSAAIMQIIISECGGSLKYYDDRFIKFTKNGIPIAFVISDHLISSYDPYSHKMIQFDLHNYTSIAHIRAFISR